MTIAEPEWWSYIEYEVVGSYPVAIGFKKGTPERIKRAYRRDQAAFRRAREQGIEL